MSNLRFWCLATLTTLAAASLAAGCIVVQPLEDYPEKPADEGGRGGVGGSSGGGGSAPDGGKSGSGATGGCSTNADCADAGTADEPYFCRQSDQRCVALRQPNCPIVAAHHLENPNAIVIGAFATLSPTNPERNPVVPAYELALEELSGDLVGGLPKGKNERQPLSLVVCYNDEAKLDSGMKHMKDAGVKGILATLKPGDLRRVYEDNIDDDLFYISPVSVTEPVARLGDDGRVWNVLGQPSDFVPTYVKAMPSVVAHARKQRALTNENITVALVTTLDAFDAELALKLKGALSFNGLSAVADNANFKTITVKSTSAEEIEAARAKLVEMQPALIISAASEVMTMLSGIIDSTETTWVLGGENTPLPIWLLSPYNAGDLENVASTIASLRSGFDKQPQNRFLGVSIAGPADNTAQFAYETRLRSNYDNINKDTANYYDAAYFLAYAMYAAGSDEPLTGETIAAGMQRLLGGDSLQIGPDTILDTFAALSEPDTTVQVESTLGPPTFDPATGVRPIDGSLFCFTGDEQVEPVMDSVRYDRKTNTLVEVGTFCISGFVQ